MEPRAEMKLKTHVRKFYFLLDTEITKFRAFIQLLLIITWLVIVLINNKLINKLIISASIFTRVQYIADPRYQILARSRPQDPCRIDDTGSFTRSHALADANVQCRRTTVEHRNTDPKAILCFTDMVSAPQAKQTAAFFRAGKNYVGHIRINTNQ